MPDAVVMIDYINAAACVALLVYAWPVSLAMRARGMWTNRLIMWAACVALALQAIGPEWASVPRAEWPQALANVVLLVWVTIWRRELMAFVRCKFGDVPQRKNFGRRREDIEQMVSRDLHHVTGGTKQ